MCVCVASPRRAADGRPDLGVITDQTDLPPTRSEPSRREPGPSLAEPSPDRAEPSAQTEPSRGELFAGYRLTDVISCLAEALPGNARRAAGGNGSRTETRGGQGRD